MLLLKCYETFHGRTFTNRAGWYSKYFAFVRNYCLYTLLGQYLAFVLPKCLVFSFDFFFSNNLPKWCSFHSKERLFCYSKCYLLSYKSIQNPWKHESFLYFLNFRSNLIKKEITLNVKNCLERAKLPKFTEILANL